MKEQLIRWSVLPSEAYDSIVFYNAISQDDFYAQHYRGIREEWSDRLGLELLETATEIKAKVISASALCYLLSYLGVETLDDNIKVFSNFPESKERLEQGLLLDTAGKREGSYWKGFNSICSNACLLEEYFIGLKETGFHRSWIENEKPMLDKHAHNFLEALENYSIERIYEKVTDFLFTKRLPVGLNIWLVKYSMPISFKLTNGAMVTHGRNLNVKSIVSTFIHEMLHGFPGSYEAQLQQSILIDIDAEFKKHYDELINKWHSNPEEYFVVAAEAYLAQYFGIRSHDECINYLNSINGGMLLSRKLYEELRCSTPDSCIEWQGYGNWLVENIKNAK